MRASLDEHVHFRAAHQSDLAALLALCAAYREADSQPLAPALVRQSIVEALNGYPCVRIVVFERSDGSSPRPFGYMVITLGFSVEAGGRDAFVDELYVESAMQGRGLGGRALVYAERVARDLGAQRLRLEVEYANEGARRLYERNGFIAHQRRILSKVLA